MADDRPSADHGADAEGGDAVCWLEHVCPECGALIDVAPNTHVCRRPVAGVASSE